MKIHPENISEFSVIVQYLGEMAEWSNAVVLKTIVLQGTGGSNPSLSAFARRSADAYQYEGGLFFYIYLAAKNELRATAHKSANKNLMNNIPEHIT